MDNNIKKAFDSIKAEEELKESTKEFLSRKLYNRKRRLILKPAYAVFVCVFIFILGFGGKIYFTPTSVISIDINPSIELSINRFNHVIDVEGYNEDGIEFASSLDVKFEKYENAIDDILNSETVTSCLSNDGLLSIAVVEMDESQSSDIYSYISSCTAGNKNMHCYEINEKDAENAHLLGLSCGKYMAYETLLKYTDEFTPEEINSMTMREIRDLIYTLSDGEESLYTQQKHHYQNGQGNQYGKKHHNN